MKILRGRAPKMFTHLNGGGSEKIIGLGEGL